MIEFTEDFKPRDKVICLRSCPKFLKEGRVYIVSEVDEHYVYLEGVHGGWLPFRFRLTIVETEPQYRMIRV